jgi:CDGSH-type Zn-finger protein
VNDASIPLPEAPLPGVREGPYEVDETPGFVAWCACGRSRYQPYCDGSHAGTGVDPMIVEISAAERVRWCGCRRSATLPFCDDRACREGAEQ